MHIYLVGAFVKDIITNRCDAALEFKMLSCFMHGGSEINVSLQ